jgi:hypothetical protein
MIRVFSDHIKDQPTREALSDLVNQSNDQTIIKGKWKFFAITVGAAVSNLRIPHGLQFKPKDKIELSVSNGATVTWNYDEFDKTYIDITTDDSCVIRALIGSYGEEA